MASACFSLVAAGAAVCGLLPAGRTPLHTITTADGGGGGGYVDVVDHNAFPAAQMFFPVPPPHDHDANPSIANPAAADVSTHKTRWGRRNRVTDDGHISGSAPLSTALLNIGGGGEGSPAAGGEEAEAAAVEVTAGTTNTVGGTKTARGQGVPDGGIRTLRSPSLGDHGQAYRNSAATTATRRRTTALEIDPRGPSEREGSGSTTPATHDFTATGAGEGDGVCSPLEIVGLGDCPEMIPDGEGGGVGSNAIIKTMLDAKADMLRQVCTPD